MQVWLIAMVTKKNDPPLQHTFEAKLQTWLILLQWWHWWWWRWWVDHWLSLCIAGFAQISNTSSLQWFSIKSITPWCMLCHDWGMSTISSRYCPVCKIQRMVESNHVRQMQMVVVPHSPQSICKTQVGHLQWKNHSHFPINLHDIITLLDISASWGSLTFLQWKESKEKAWVFWHEKNLRTSALFIKQKSARPP